MNYTASPKFGSQNGGEWIYQSSLYRGHNIVQKTRLYFVLNATSKQFHNNADVKSGRSTAMRALAKK
jgi:hypothetical protein